MSGGPDLMGTFKVLPPLFTDEEKARRNGNGSDKKAKQPKEHGARFHVLNDFVDVALSSIEKTDAAVWLVLYRDTRDGVARTSQADIARRAGMCRRTVVTCIQRLREAGLLAVEHQGGLTGGMSAYRVKGIPK